MDTCYFSIIERDRGWAPSEAWVPDLPGVTRRRRRPRGSGAAATVFRDARECLRNLIVTGQPLPPARPARRTACSAMNGSSAVCC